MVKFWPIAVKSNTQNLPKASIIGIGRQDTKAFEERFICYYSVTILTDHGGRLLPVWPSLGLLQNDYGRRIEKKDRIQKAN